MAAVVVVEVVAVVEFDVVGVAIEVDEKHTSEAVVVVVLNAGVMVMAEDTGQVAKDSLVQMVQRAEMHAFYQWVGEEQKQAMAVVVPEAVAAAAEAFDWSYSLLGKFDCYYSPCERQLDVVYSI